MPRFATIVLAATPGGEVVLKPLVCAAIPDLELDAVDAVRRLRRALDRELESVGTTRPSIGSAIVVSILVAAGPLLKSKKATRPTLSPPWRVAVAAGEQPREVTSMALLPSNEFEPGFHSTALPVAGSSAPRWSRRTTCVAEAVAGETLSGPVADVVEAGPRIGRGRRLVPREVAADVDRVSLMATE